jgi:hypothetical protein
MRGFVRSAVLGRQAPKAAIAVTAVRIIRLVLSSRLQLYIAAGYGMSDTVGLDADGKIP